MIAECFIYHINANLKRNCHPLTNYWHLSELYSHQGKFNLFHYFLFETYQVTDFVGEIGIDRNYKLWAFTWYQICVAGVDVCFKVKSANLYETTIKHEFLTGSRANFGIAMYYLIPFSYMFKGPYIWYRMKGKCVFLTAQTNTEANYGSCNHSWTFYWHHPYLERDRLCLWKLSVQST